MRGFIRNSGMLIRIYCITIFYRRIKVRDGNGAIICARLSRCFADERLCSGAHTGVTIISGESELIKHKLVNELGRGISVYKGERGLPGSFEVSHEVNIVFTLVIRLALGKLKNPVYNADPLRFCLRIRLGRLLERL